MKSLKEPRWDIDLEYGRQGELQIGDFLEWIAKGDGRVEVKRKRYLDLSIYVETEQDPGRRGCYKPSGINTTKALMYAVIIGDTGIHIGIPVDLLRDAMDDCTTKDCREDDGDNPTKGKLIRFDVLLLRLKQQREGKDVRAPKVAAPASKPAAAVDRTPLATPLTADDMKW